MKKRAVIFILILLLISGCIPAQARPLNLFYVRTNYGQLVSYENIPYRYAINVYEGFHMYSEEALNAIWADMEQDEDDDYIYDFRYWVSPDNTFRLTIQVKEQTYDSFATEIAKAPQYADTIRPKIEALGYTDLKLLHEGVLRQTPEGMMLETAYSYNVPQENGTTLNIITVYYDCYYENIEYIFEINAYDSDYESAQQLLDNMVQTLHITPSGRPI